MLNNEERFLPYSGRRYRVNQYGEIFHNDVKLETEIIDENVFVEISWIFGKKKYFLGVLVYLTFRPIALKEYLWDKLIPLHKDDNFRNNVLSNLFYRFKDGRLEVDSYPGFYYVPLYTNYAINETGDIINVSSGNKMSWYITKPTLARNSTGGYYSVRLMNDLGGSACMLRHRLICFVFKVYPSNYQTLCVNHIDGVPGNDIPDNLEWVTISQNNKHADDLGLCPNKRTPILMWDLNSNEIKRFDSILSCCKYLGYDKNTFISYRLKYCGNKVFSDKLLFKYDDGKDWPVIDLNNIIIDRSNSCDIMARNVFTGDIIVFSSCNAGEKLLGVLSPTILSHVRKRILTPVNGYNFRYVVDGGDWPVHSERHLQSYRKHPLNPPDGMIVYNTETKKEIYYTSVEECAAAFNLSISYIFSLSKHQKIFNSLYKFTLFKLKESLRSS